MVGVLKIERVSFAASKEDVQGLFQRYGVYPEDVHWVKSDGKSTRSAFLAFRNSKGIQKGLQVGGSIFHGERVSVHPSSPLEFNKFFPSKPMFAKDAENPPIKRSGNYTLNYNNQNRYNDGAERNNKPQYNNSNDNGGNRQQQRNDVRNERQHGPANNNKQEYDNSLQRNNRNDTRPKRNIESFNNKNMHGPFKGNDINGQRFIPTRKPNFITPNVGYDGNKNSFDSGRKPAGPVRNDANRNNAANRNNVENMKYNQRNTARPGRMEQQGESQRRRSRSPMNNRDASAVRNSYVQNYGGEQQRRRSDGYRQDGRQAASQQSAPPPVFQDVNERKFLRITGLSYKVTPNIIEEFFRPLRTVNIFLLKFTSGNYAGRLNGSAMVEFFNEEVTQEALTYDGTKSASRTISVFRAAKDDVVAAIEASLGDTNQAQPQVLVADVSTLNALANTNPEVQHLVGLLNAAVTNSTGPPAIPQPSKQSSGREHSDQPASEHSDRRQSSGHKNDDPVINRVASSANIDVDDIKNGRVVGMRNLPYKVTPDLILTLFRGFHAIEDSVRIHYLDNGRCSGDAIICFRGNREARRAVRELNKKIIHNRKVELFFL